MIIKDLPECYDERECFARQNGKCTILNEAPTDVCKFCKPRRDVTNGKAYPSYTIVDGVRKTIRRKPAEEEGE